MTVYIGNLYCDPQGQWTVRVHKQDAWANPSDVVEVTRCGNGGLPAAEVRKLAERALSCHYYTVCSDWFDKAYTKVVLQRPEPVR